MSDKISVKQKIVIIGCGNVAWHLAKHLVTLKKYNLEVYNHRNSRALSEFRRRFGCKIHTSLNNIATDGDYYILCVSDSAIASAAGFVNPKKAGAVLMHTSGSANLDLLGSRVHACAVFYPFQTFSKGDTINWREIPLVIETKDAAVRKRLTEFAEHFSGTVVPMNYQERLRLHLTGVLVNNFTNALYQAAIELNTTGNKPRNIELLLPLIRQTVKKLDKLAPLKAQTGPAKRGDKEVIKKHINLLKDRKELKKIYKQMTKLIISQHQQHA